MSIITVDTGKANGSGTETGSSSGAPATERPRERPSRGFLLADLQIGKPDGRGRLVSDILWRVTDFAIYKTPLGVSAQFSDDPALAAAQARHYLEIGKELTHMNFLIHLSHGGRASLTYYEREMATGIAQSLVGNVEEARLTLTTVSEQLEKVLQNKGRAKFFMTCLAVASAIVGVTLVLNLAAISPARTWLVEVTTVIMVGSLGALLSTAIGLKHMKIDACIDWMMQTLYGGVRMLVGVLGALALYAAVKSGVALAAVLETDLSAVSVAEGASLDLYRLAFISVLAGFSERLVPNLLDRESAGPTSGPAPAPAGAS